MVEAEVAASGLVRVADDFDSSNMQVVLVPDSVQQPVTAIQEVDQGQEEEKQAARLPSTQ